MRAMIRMPAKFAIKLKSSNDPCLRESSPTIARPNSSGRGEAIITAAMNGA